MVKKKYTNHKFYTGEAKEEVEEYLASKGLEYIYRDGCSAFYIDDPKDTNKAYDFRYTTGRWGVLWRGRNINRKHYRSRGVVDFVDNYLMKSPLTNNNYVKARHINQLEQNLKETFKRVKRVKKVEKVSL